MQVSITKHLLQPSLGVILLCIIYSTILWFLPFAFDKVDANQLCDVRFMDHYVLWSWPYWVSNVVAYFATLALMFWVMQICERLQIIPMRSAIPFVVGLLLWSTIGYVQLFDERFFSCVLFILALRQLLSMYHFEWQVAAGFNIVCLLCMASLFVPQFLWLFILFFVGMIVFRVVSVRVFVSVILGFALLSFLLFGGFWVFDALDILIGYLNSSFDLTFIWQASFPRSDVFLSVILLVLCLFSLLYYFSMNSNYKLNVRLNYIFVNCSFWISLVLLCCFAQNLPHILMVPLLFINLSLSLYFSTNYNELSSYISLAFVVIMSAYRVLNLYNF